MNTAITLTESPKWWGSRSPSAHVFRGSGITPLNGPTFQFSARSRAATADEATASAQPSAVGGVHPIPVARSTPQASGGPLAGLQIPITAMFRQLNSETKATAVGQYSILHSIERVLRDQLEAFLRWVTRGH